MAEPKGVFISYSHHDRDFVDKLISDLKKHEIPYWVDQKLTLGTDFRNDIKQAIKSSRGVILVASPSASQSEFIQNELIIAQEERLPIFPIWAAGDKWTDCVPLDIVKANYLDCREAAYEKSFEELVQFLSGANEIGQQPASDFPSKTLKKADEDPFVDKKEVEFLRAFLRLVEPGTNLSDPISSIIVKNYYELKEAVESLKANQNWQALLEIKRRLREYFEYSGKYLDGAAFGREYVIAQRNLNQPLEAIWTRVKHIGYLLVLAGGTHIDDGRREISEALEELDDLSGDNPTSENECRFYAHRYLGISYQRANEPDLRQARAQFDEAQKYIDRFDYDAKKQTALNARLLGNFGNMALDQRDHDKALAYYEQSLKIFSGLSDTEHIGIAQLKIAEALNSRRQDIAKIPSYLKSADLIFISIGWIEGQARVEEQKARYLVNQANRTQSSDQKRAFVQEASIAITRGTVLFERVGQERGVGRMEMLKERISEMQ